jgi:hypothetical protein
LDQRHHGANFVGGDAGQRGGVRLALHDANADRVADLAVGSGAAVPSRARIYKSATVLAGASSPDQDLDPPGVVIPNGYLVPHAHCGEQT